MPGQIPDHYDIIGEHRIASCRFLVVDEAGQRYTWDVERRQLTPMALVSMAEWRLDVDRDGVAARVPDGPEAALAAGADRVARPTSRSRVMVEWWYLVVIVVVLIIAVVVFRNRQERERHRPRPDDRADRNYVGEREDTRLGGMSAEDRDWEQASLQRNRDRQAGTPTPGGSQAAPPERADRGAGE